MMKHIKKISFWFSLILLFKFNNNLVLSNFREEANSISLSSINDFILFDFNIFIPLLRASW